MKFGTLVKPASGCQKHHRELSPGVKFFFFLGGGQKFHFGEIFNPNFWGSGQRDVGSLEHIKQKSLVQFPQQIPTISAKAHQFFGPIFEFQALKNCWGQTHPQ